MIRIQGLLVWLVFAVNTMGATPVDITPSMIKKDAKQIEAMSFGPQNTEVTLLGRLTCWPNSFKSAQSCDLRFIDQSGQDFSVESSPSLAKALCKKDWAMNVKVQGIASARPLGLSWKLKIKSLKALSKTNPGICSRGWALQQKQKEPKVRVVHR